MPTFIQLLKLLPEGRQKLVHEPDSLLDVQRQIHAPDVNLLGVYAVLGSFDFVNIVEAPDNEAVARYSVHLGQAAGVDVMTMPAIPMARFVDDTGPEPEVDIAGAEEPLPAVFDYDSED